VYRQLLRLESQERFWLWRWHCSWPGSGERTDRRCERWAHLRKEEPHCLIGWLDDGNRRIRIARCVST
jgi:hypothetical protein